MCTNEMVTFICTSSGNELVWRRNNENLYRFSSGSSAVQGGSSPVYSVLLAHENGVRTSSLTFSRLQESSFSLTCFDGSSGVYTISVEVAST